MKLNMYHEPIILPRVIVVLVVAALAAIGVEVGEDNFGAFSLAEVLTAVAIAGVAYIGDGLQKRAFTDSPATVDRVYREAVDTYREDVP